MEQLNITNPYTDLNTSNRVSQYFSSFFIKIRNIFKNQCKIVIAYLIAFSQGLTGLSDIAFSFLMKDILHFNPADSSRANSLSYIPWMIKPIFGLISDSLPICGYRRKSYLLINSIFFIGTFLSLYLWCHISWVAIGCLILGSFNMAFCNVIGEALVVESSNEKGKDVATQNVSSFFLIKAIGRLLSTISSGYILKNSSPNFMFLLSSFMPLIISISCFFLNESPKESIKNLNVITDTSPIGENLSDKKYSKEINLDLEPNIINDLSDIRKERTHEFIDLKKEQFNSTKKINTINSHSTIKNNNDNYEGFEKVTTLKSNKNTSTETTSEKAVSGIENYQKLDDEKENSIKIVDAKSDGTLVSPLNQSEIKDTEIVTTSFIRNRFEILYNFICQKHVSKPILFILAFSAAPSYDDTMFYFYTNILNFDEIFIGRLTFTGAIASILGITLYKKWLYKFGFKCIMLSSTLILTFFSMLAIALVLRWNIAMGIPDYLFCLTSSSLAVALSEINTMPLLIYAANLCPKNIEGTTYALIMSVMNFGGFLSYNFGSILTSFLGITSSKFDNLWLLIFISNVLSLVPLPFLRFINMEKVPVVLAEENIKEEIKT